MHTKTVITAIGEDICIPVPRNIPSISGVWPKSPTNMSIGNNCECPFCHSTDGKCGLDKCHCINETMYKLSLRSTGLVKYDLCVHNASSRMNGMYVQFVSDFFSCFPASIQEISSIVYRQYIGSYRISVGMIIVLCLCLPPVSMYCMTAELPSQPILSIWRDKICVETTSPPEFPVLHYELLISDVTGEKRLFRNVSATVNCTSIEYLLDDTTCSPLEVSVRAYNRKGRSNVSSLLAGNETGETIIDLFMQVYYCDKHFLTILHTILHCRQSLSSMHNHAHHNNNFCVTCIGYSICECLNTTREYTKFNGNLVEKEINVYLILYSSSQCFYEW